jgi:hypothetical protein
LEPTEHNENRTLSATDIIDGAAPLRTALVNLEKIK